MAAERLAFTLLPEMGKGGSVMACTRQVHAGASPTKHHECMNSDRIREIVGGFQGVRGEDAMK
jgi:hypothetical protein